MAVELTEGSTYLVKATTTNMSTKAGVPVAATLTVNIAAVVNSQIIMEDSEVYGFAADETHTFEFSMAVPMGAGGKAGAVVAEVLDPNGNKLADGSLDVVIIPVGVAEFAYVSGIRRSREEIGSSLYFILEVDVQNQGSIGGTCTLALYCSFRSFYSGGPIPDYTAWEIARGGLSQYEVLQAYIGPGQIVTFRGLVDFYEYFERADHTVMRVKFVGDPGEIVSSGFLVRED